MAGPLNDTNQLALVRAVQALLQEKVNEGTGFRNAIPGSQTPAQLLAALVTAGAQVGGP